MKLSDKKLGMDQKIDRRDFLNGVSIGVVGSILGNTFASKSGCPTLYGVLLHALFYCCILVGVMYLP